MGPRRAGAARHGGTLDSSVVPDFAGLPPTYGEILNGDYGCLDAVAQHTQTNGDQVQLWSCTGRSNQLWSYNQSTGEIVNYSDGKCLDANGHSIGNGDKAELYSCNVGGNQGWFP